MDRVTDAAYFTKAEHVLGSMVFFKLSQSIIQIHNIILYIASYLSRHPII